MIMDFVPIGKNIRKVRKGQKKRQEDIAEAAGISVTYYGAIERGEKTPSLEILINIINTLGVSADVVLCDVIDADYEIRNSLVSDKMKGLSKENVDLVSDIIDAVKKHSK